MKTSLKLRLLVLALSCLSGSAHAQGGAISYQGRLNDSGQPATGLYDFSFTVFDVAVDGAGLTEPVPRPGVSVANGLFNVSVDFGPGVFTGPARWLQIAVRTNGSAGAFTLLNPRQALTASPYAITAGDVTGANISRLNVPNTATQATAVPTVNFGFIVNAAVTSGGSGYGTAPLVTVNDPTGAGAIITATVEAGAVIRLTVQNPGSGYSAGATLTISPPPSNAFQTFVSPNFFTGVNMMNNINNTFAGKFTGDGAGLTLDASQLAGGTVADARLSANVPLLNGSPTFAGVVTAAGFRGPGALPWQVVSGTAQQAQPNTGYLLTNDALVTVTLPPFPNPGDVVRVSGTGAEGWKVTQNVSQSIVAQNISGNFGAIWMPRENNRSWGSIASSSDGSKLVAVVSPGQIYTSTDSGVTWTPHESNRSWWSVASSSDGSQLVAVVLGGPIYTSADSGVTWTPRVSSRDWRSVASSSDGSKLVAVVNGGVIYTSNNSFMSWNARESIRDWRAVASSSDGSKHVAVVYGGQIYTSTDSGVTWTPRESDRNWQSVASSTAGNKLVAAVYGGQIYTSTDSGETWTSRESNRNWNSVASSADGSKLVALGYGGPIYTSTDSGVTWTAHESSRNWQSAAASSDGSKLVAAAYAGQIYTSSSTSTSGTAGYLLGDQLAAVELQYIGNGQFILLSHEGTIIAH